MLYHWHTHFAQWLAAQVIKFPILVTYSIISMAEHCRFKSHLRQLIFYLEKKELSLGIVALLCLVSLTEFTCTYLFKTGPPTRLEYLHFLSLCFLYKYLLELHQLKQLIPVSLFWNRRYMYIIVKIEPYSCTGDAQRYMGEWESSRAN